jgi:hypothetical protein
MSLKMRDNVYVFAFYTHCIKLFEVNFKIFLILCDFYIYLNICVHCLHM